MPPKNVHRIALFTIMVEDRDGVASEREVIAVYENFANPTELSDGKVAHRQSPAKWLGHKRIIAGIK